MTVAAPPGYEVLQGPPTNIVFQGPARRSTGGFNVVQPQEGQRNYDRYFYGQQTYRNACRATLSGYTAEVIATFDRGRYSLYARWDANQWGGGDAGKWLEATINSPRVEEAIELRAILHTMRPADTGRADVERGEWLAVVISGSRYEDVSALRRTLFAISFPDERFPGRPK